MDEITITTSKLNAILPDGEWQTLGEFARGVGLNVQGFQTIDDVLHVAFTINDAKIFTYYRLKYAI